MNGGTRRAITTWLPLALILAALACYFAFIWRYAMNVPFADDIFDVLKMLSDALAAPDFGSALHVMYTQHNDHRTLATRLLYLGDYLLAGRVDFVLLTFLANLALPLLLCCLYLTLRRRERSLLLLLPAALLLLQLRCYGITLWSMAAFAYFYVFLYGCFTLYCLHRVTPARFALACLLATLATFTLASGQLAWLLGAASLAQQILLRRTAPLRYLLIWAAFALLAYAAWRTGLATPNRPVAMLQRLAADPGYYLLYALTLTGSVVTEKSVPVAASAGALMLGALAALSLRMHRREDLRLELYCWYAVLTIAAMTLGRAPYSTVDYALGSRYSFPSVLLLATLWLLAAVRLRLRRPQLLLAAALLAGIYCATSYRLYAHSLQPYLEKRIATYNRGNYWAWPHPMRETNAIVERAIALGIYRPPPRPLRLPESLLMSGERRD